MKKSKRAPVPKGGIKKDQKVVKSEKIPAVHLSRKQHYHTKLGDVNDEKADGLHDECP